MKDTDAREDFRKDWLCDLATTNSGCLPVIVVLVGWVISVALILMVCVVAWGSL